MSRLDTLLHGEATDAATLITKEMPSNRDEILLELRAALCNALRRIDALENEVKALIILR